MRSKSVLIPILFLSACLTGDDEELGATEQDLAGGDIVTSPWTVGMVQLVRSNGSFFCSGTLIAPDWVLTAGHCAVTAGADQVRLGNVADSNAQVSAIDRVIGNPAMDLGLVHLSKSFDVPGGLFFRRSLFSDPTATLLGKTARFYGSSNDPTCTPASCGYGWLRSADVRINRFGSHNLGGSTPNGEYTVGGDSGGGLLYETAAGKELAGVLKCGLGDCLVRPEAFRGWAFSYLYDLPVELPAIWNYGASSGHFFAVPLQDSYTASSTFDVCPGGRPYTYNLTYNLESNYDYVRVRSSQPERSYTGAGTAAGSGQGPMTLTIQTDASVRSQGISAFTVQCQNGIQFPNPWGVPSPAGTNDVRSWDPCPGNETWRWTAEYAYAGGGSGMVGTTSLSGSGTASQTARGPVNVASYTPSGGTDGLRRLTASCDLAIPCHGNTCFTKTASTSAPRVAVTSWTPCGGGGFRYRVNRTLASGDSLRVTGGTTSEYSVYLGSGTSPWRQAGGTLNLQLNMSTFAAGHGIKELVAQCDAWGADRTSTVQVLRGTYGRNCRVNPDNATQKLVEHCKAVGGSTCNYPISTAVLGDPAVNCAKDYTAEWTCGTSSVVKKVVIPGEANGRTATLSCP